MKQWNTDSIFDGIDNLFGKASRGLDELFKEEEHSYDSDFGDPKTILNKRNRGYCIGGRPDMRMSMEANHEGLAIIGTTGSGKSSSNLFPSIVPGVMDGSKVIVDIMNEATHKSGKCLQEEQGDDMSCINFTNDKESDGWNIVSRIEEGDVSGAEKIAEGLTRTGLGEQPKELFWKNSAKKGLTATIGLVKSLPDKACHHMAQVHDFVNKIQTKPEALDPIIAQYARREVRDVFLGFAGGAENTNASILSTMQACLSPWSNPVIRKITSTDTVDLSVLRKRPSTIFITGTVTLAPVIAPVVSGMCDQLFDELYSQNPTEKDETVHFICDEFPVLSPLSNFYSICNTARKIKLSICIYAQSLQQLESRYGKSEAQAILSGLRSKVFFGAGLDNATAAEISTYLGKYMYEDDQGRTFTRSLMEPFEIQRMGPEELIFLSAHHPPMKIPTLPYYKQRKLRKLFDQGPMEWTRAPLPEPVLFDLENMDRVRR